LRASVGWPSSLLADDVLFLVLVPWISDMWYPALAKTIEQARIAARVSRVLHLTFEPLQGLESR